MPARLRHRRSWRGWFYYLDPRLFSNACAAYSEPYIAQSGGLRLGMLDSASVLEDGTGRSQVERYAAQLRSFSGQVSWIADHHPFWAFKSGVPGGGAVISRPLAGAWESAKPGGVRLILSGHVHLFEFLAFEHGRPAQLVAGDSGTALAKSLAPDFSGATVGGAAVESGKSRQEFGYTVLRRRGKGWLDGERDAGCRCAQQQMTAVQFHVHWLCPLNGVLRKRRGSRAHASFGCDRHGAKYVD